MKINTLRVWAWRLALIVTVIVALLSFLGGSSFLEVVLRSILAYGLIYGLSEGSFYLFEKTGMKDEQDLSSNLGALLDIAVGQDEEVYPIDLDSEPGEISAGAGTYGKARYAQGGMGQAPLPGQVTHDLAQGLPDEEKQAEIVRRMGWGE